MSDNFISKSECEAMFKEIFQSCGIRNYGVYSVLEDGSDAPGVLDGVSTERDVIVYTSDINKKDKIQSFIGEFGDVIKKNQYLIIFVDDSKPVQKIRLKARKQKLSVEQQPLLLENELDPWLRTFIYDEMKAKYSPDHLKVENNTENSDEDNLWYLGTYFPRTFVKISSILTNLLSNQKIFEEFEKKSVIRVLSAGCGTGGDLVAVLKVFHELYKNTKQFEIQAVDANSGALSLMKKVVGRASGEYGINPAIGTFNKDIDNYFDSRSPVTAPETKFDLIITSKMLNEKVSVTVGQEQNVYYNFTKNAYEYLDETGLLVISDVTNKPNYPSVYGGIHERFYPEIMNEGINKAVLESDNLYSLIPVSCARVGGICPSIDCFSQKEFLIKNLPGESGQINASSKISYRVLCKSQIYKKFNIHISCMVKISSKNYCNYLVNAVTDHVSEIDGFDISNLEC